MSQHDFIIDNQAFPAIRGDINSALQALAENSSGASEPTTTYAFQFWADTSTGLLKIRNAANSAWVTIGTLASVNLGLIASSIVDAKGDLISASADNTPARTPVGADGKILMADSSQSTGLSWVSAIDGFRNRIINGNMRIDQRNSGSSVGVSVNGTYTVDRWQGSLNGSPSGAYSLQQLTTSPPTYFTHYLRIKTTTADASPGSSVGYSMRQIIEGYNCSDILFGSSSAKAVTISFWVRSSLTGNFSGSLQNAGGTRSYPFTFTISAAHTWEWKSITIAGDQTGTWPSDNSGSMTLVFDIGSGSSLKGAASTWASANYWGVTGSANLISTLNATLDFTGVQLEAGSIATVFERRPYSAELALCQRYYEVFGAGLASGAIVYLGSYSGYPGGSAGVWQFKTSKRALPTIFLNPTGTAGSVDRISNDLVAIFNGVTPSYCSVGAGSTASSEL